MAMHGRVFAELLLAPQHPGLAAGVTRGVDGKNLSILKCCRVLGTGSSSRGVTPGNGAGTGDGAAWWRRLHGLDFRVDVL